MAYLPLFARAISQGCLNFVFEALSRLVHGGGRRLRRTTDAVSRCHILSGSLGETIFVDRNLVHRLLPVLGRSAPVGPVMFLRASQISLLAASSLGKCPRVLMILRSWALMLSIALVV